jgi:hypothetical protein
MSAGTSGKCGATMALAMAVAAMALLGIAAAPASAFKGGHFEGTVNLEPASRITFDLVKTKKKIGRHKWRRTTKIENVAFEGALAGCGEESIAPIGTPIPASTKLKDKGRFTLKTSSPGRSLELSGNFVRRFRAVYGEFRLAGRFEVDGELRTCDTGPRGWTGRRTSSTPSA